MTDYLKTTASIIGTVFGLCVIIFLIIPALWSWGVQNHTVISDSVAKFCGLEETVLTTLNATMIQEIKDERSREIAQKIMDGQKVSDCDWSTFLKYLDKDERKKLKIYDVVCDFSSCVK
jgi:hypothetical protein